MGLIGPGFFYIFIVLSLSVPFRKLCSVSCGFERVLKALFIFTLVHSLP